MPFYLTLSESGAYNTRRVWAREIRSYLGVQRGDRGVQVICWKEEVVLMRLILAMIGVVLLAMPAAAAEDKIAEEVAELNLSQQKLVELGDFIYNTEGANTCLKCHGKGGHGGDQAGAADLRHPKTWRSYQALGGDAAFAADKDAFIKKMETALHYLISKGATTWNLRFAKTHKGVVYDWSKVEDADKYNNMMKGLTTGPMRNRVRELKKKLGDAGKKLKTHELEEVATVADFEYVKTLDDGSDKGGVFK
jgi:hypothetical protein